MTYRVSGFLDGRPFGRLVTATTRDMAVDSAKAFANFNGQVLVVNRVEQVVPGSKE